MMDTEETWLSNLDLRMLDAEIAVKIFDWEWSVWGDRKILSPPLNSQEALLTTMWDKQGLPQYLPNYTTSVSYALEALDKCGKSYVIEKLPNSGFAVAVDKYIGFGPNVSLASVLAICKKYGREVE